MTVLYMASALVVPDSGVSAWLVLAADAAVLDRLAEWFIGQPAFKTEVAMLALGNAFAGAGFLVLGATRLGLDLPPVAGLHMLSVGALGCADHRGPAAHGPRSPGPAVAGPWGGLADGCRRFRPRSPGIRLRLRPCAVALELADRAVNIDMGGPSMSATRVTFPPIGSCAIDIRQSSALGSSLRSRRKGSCVSRLFTGLPFVTR